VNCAVFIEIYRGRASNDAAPTGLVIKGELRALPAGARVSRFALGIDGTLAVGR
jgi:hypothetical protein